MSLRILVAVLFVGGCAGRQPVLTTPPPHVAWVPEARALLGWSGALHLRRIEAAHRAYLAFHRANEFKGSNA